MPNESPSKPFNRLLFFSLFTGLYMIQGFAAGLNEFTAIQLNASKTSLMSLGLFHSASFPSYLKCFFGPLLDTWYRPSFGKRMSYIVPFSAAIVSILFFFAWNLDQMIAEGEVLKLTGIMFLLNMLYGVQDVAIDSLVDEFYSKEYVIDGVNAQNVGQILGGFVTGNILLMTHSHYETATFVTLIGVGIFILLSTLSSFILFREKSEPRVWSSPFAVIRVLPKVFSNRTSREYVLFLWTVNAAYFISQFAISESLIREGIDRASLGLVSTIFTVLTLVAVMFLKNIQYYKHRTFIFKNVYLVRIVEMGFSSAVFWYFISSKNQSGAFWLFLASFPFKLAGSMFFLANASTNFTVADPLCNATHLGVLNSFSNFAMLTLKSLSSFMLGLIGLKGILVFSVVYSLVYYRFVLLSFLEKFEKREPKDYWISSKQASHSPEDTELSKKDI